MSRVYLSEIYDYFLSSISDYTILNKSDYEIEEDLYVYFKKARAKFYKCRNKLDIMVDENDNKYFGHINSQGIKVDTGVTDFEKLIITHLMIVEYLKPLVLSTEVIKQSLSDRDFKIYSQANQLRELSLLYRNFKKESGKMITEYSYMGMTDDDRK